MRCSAACTRAGLTAILFAAIAIAVLQPLENATARKALRQYVYLRIQLTNALDQLAANPCWMSLSRGKSADQVLKTWDLSTLMGYECQINDSIEESEIKDKPKQTTLAWEPMFKWNPPTVRNGKIGPPQNLRVVYPLLEIQEVADILTKLGDGAFLTHARLYSDHFNFSIYKWEIFRHSLLMQKQSKGVVIVIPSKEVIRQDPSFPRNELLRHLTLENVRTLAKYELPILSDAGSSLREKELITLPSIGIPILPESAAIFIELGLLVSLIYFWLYLLEAKRSENFPAPSTIFGVFSNTFITQNIYYIFCTIPAISAILLGIHTFDYTYINIILASFVLLFSSLISYETKLR